MSEATGHVRPFRPSAQEDLDVTVFKKTTLMPHDAHAPGRVLVRLTERPYGWPIIVGTVWFFLTFVGILWLWGGASPRVFNSPDEATTKYASELVADTGRPRFSLPAEDAEDLMHLRVWVSVGDEAVPVVAPMTFYLHAFLGAVPLVGAYLVPLLSAAGAGAFAAAVTVLGQRRPWVGLLVPAAAFPGLYWLLRPWMNMSLFIAFLSFALLVWAVWRRERGGALLGASGAFVALAVAVRPDYAAVTLLVALLLTLAEAKAAEVKTVAVTFISAGAMAVALILVFNAAVTGDPLTFGYEIQEKYGLRAGYTPSRQSLPTPISELYFLFLPNGVPEIGEIARQVQKYWLQMWPIPLLTLSLPFALVMLLKDSGRRRMLYAGGILLALLFVITRVGPDFFGASLEEAEIHHSLPRYWAPVYLLAVIPIVLLAMRSQSDRIWLPALFLVAFLAISGAQHIYVSGGPESMVGLRYRLSSAQARLDEFKEFVPDDAIVYSSYLDKVLWSGWDLGVFPGRPDQGLSTAEMDRTVSSIRRAADTGRPVYLIRRGQISDDDFHLIEGMLFNEGLALRQSGPPTLQTYAVEQRGVALLPVEGGR